MDRNHEYVLLITKLECEQSTGESGHDEIYLQIYVNGDLEHEYYQSDTLDMNDSDDDMRYVDLEIKVKFLDTVEVRLLEQDKESNPDKDEHPGSVYINRSDPNEGYKTTDGDAEYRVYWQMIDRPIPTLRVHGLYCERSSSNCNTDAVDAVANVSSAAAEAASLVLGAVKTPKAELLSEAFQAAAMLIEVVAVAYEWLMDTIEGDDDVYLQHVDKDTPAEDNGSFCPPDYTYDGDAVDEQQLKMNDDEEISFLETYGQYFRFPFDDVDEITIGVREHDDIKGDISLGSLTVTEAQYDDLIDKGCQIMVLTEYLDDRDGQGAIYHLAYSVVVENWADPPNQMYTAKPDRPPIPPFEADVSLVEGYTEDEWAEHILDMPDWTVSLGSLDSDLQCIDSVLDVDKHSVVVQGHLSSPVATYSYIAVQGDGAYSVDVDISPTTNAGTARYQGWNGEQWIDGPATYFRGFYWYRIELTWAASDTGTHNIYAKTNRVEGYMDPQPFRLWAYKENSSFEPNIPAPTPPFDIALEPVEGQSGAEWSSNLLGILGWSLTDGNFNAGLGYVDSVSDSSNQKVVAYGTVSGDVQVASYIAVQGEGAEFVDVAVSISTDEGLTSYQGWDGSAWVDGPAARIDGCYWYRLDVHWSESGSYSIYAKNYRAEGNEGQYLPFKLWAYKEPGANTYAPFDADLAMVQGQSSDEWASNVLGIPQWTVDAGTFYADKQCVDTVAEGSSYQVVRLSEGCPSPIDVVSYVAVQGEGFDELRVEVAPNCAGAEPSMTVFQGWNGSAWVDGPAIAVDGLYWYRLQVNWVEDGGYNELYIKSHVESGEAPTVRMWTFRDK